MLLFSVALPMALLGYLKTARVVCCYWVALSLASPRLSSWSLTSSSLQDPFSPGTSSATEATPSLMASLTSHIAKPQLLSLTPSIF